MANLDVTLSGAHLAQGLVTPAGGGADTTLADMAAASHAAVTVAGTPDYVTLSGQQLTLNAVDLATDVTGTLQISSGGTGATTASAAFAAIKQVATTTVTGVVELATNGETTAGLAVQANDARLSDARTPTAHDHSSNKLAQANTHESADTDTATTSLHHTIGTSATQAAAGNHTHAQLHDPVTLAGTPTYITITGQQITRGLVSLSNDVTGTLPIASGGTGASDAATAFANLKVAASETATGVVELATNAEVATGTDTTRAVTPSGAASRYQPLDAELTAWAGLTSAADTLGYFSGSGTATTTTLSSFGRSLIDDADAATARATLGLGSVYAPLRYTIATETESTRTNSATDATAFVEWTSTSAKTFTVNTEVATAGDVWNGANTGTNTLTIAAGTSPGTMTLVGSLSFTTGKAYSIVFITNSRAIVIGGA